MNKFVKKIKTKLCAMGYFWIGIHMPTYYSYKNKFFGKISRRFRVKCARGFCRYVGENVNIQKGALISAGLSIDDFSGIGKNSDAQGDITIGKNVMMGPECVFYTNGHKTDRTDIPMSHQGMTESKPIVIGDDVWIGRRVIFLPGVHVGGG